MLQISEYSFSLSETSEPSNVVITEGIFKRVIINSYSSNKGYNRRYSRQVFKMWYYSPSA